MLAGIFHFSFTVSDLERSVVWYTDALGMELVHRQVQDNDYTRTLVGMPDATLEIAQLKLPGVPSGASTHILELVEYRTPAGAATDLRTQNVGVPHLAFLVDDVTERYERMRAMGVAFVSAPVAITAGANKGGFTCYLRDPDGITLELFQPSPERLREIGIAAQGPTED
jgi:catechol 2,3-dioxygenase-like lactoylglutathione lyase family enzyme